MLSSDLDSAEDTAASAPNDAEREEQEELEDDSPAESDVQEEVGVDMAVMYCLIFNWNKNLKNEESSWTDLVLINKRLLEKYKK